MRRPNLNSSRAGGRHFASIFCSIVLISGAGLPGFAQSNVRQAPSGWIDDQPNQPSAKHQGSQNSGYQTPNYQNPTYQSPGEQAPSYPNAGYANGAYPNGAYPNGAYPNASYPSPAYQNQGSLNSQFQNPGDLVPQLQGQQNQASRYQTPQQSPQLGEIEQQNQTGSPSIGRVLQGSSSKTMLQGGVSHSQELPALPKQFKIGATYQDEPQQQAKEDGWYWIPSWLAGDWRRDEETIVSEYDYMTGEGSHIPHTIMATELAQFGQQRDSQGGIWHCRLASSGLADCGSYFSVAQIQKQEPVSVTKDRVVIKDVFTELRVNKDTHAIIDSVQAESITEYFPMKDGVLKVSSSVKIFDEQGVAKKLQNNVSTTTRTKPFLPTNFYKDRNLRASFKRYLESHNLSNLIPP